MNSSGTARPHGRRLRIAAATLTAAGTALFGLTGLASATTAHASSTHAKAVTAKAPVGDLGTTIDPLQANCGVDAPSCGHVGESYSYYNGTNVNILYTEKWYCDATPGVVSLNSTSGCEAGTPPGAVKSATSSGSSGTSLGNTTQGDTLYIPVPLFTSPAVATQCPAGSATIVCIDHPATIDLSRIGNATAVPYLGADFSAAKNIPIPAHNHVVATRNGGLPEWWNVKVVATNNPATFATLTSAAAIFAASSGPNPTAAVVPTNAYLFFQVLPGTVPAAQASNQTVTIPLTAGYGPPPTSSSAANQAESGTTFNNLKNDCGQSTPNCQNIGITHSWVSGAPGSTGQDVQLLYTEQYLCTGSAAASGCEAGAPATKVPPGVGDPLVPTAANSAPGATGNGQIDPLYIPVPLGFTPTYAQCPGVIVCIDHPTTIDLSAIAQYLPGAPAASTLTNVPLPSHDHVIRTRNGDQPEWWNVEVVPVTSQAQLTAIENLKNLTPAQEAPFNPTTNPGGAIDTNTYLWFQSLPGQAVATPGPVQTSCMTKLPAGGVTSAAALPDGTGYVETDSKGDVAVFGAAACYGSMSGATLNKPIVGITVDRQTGGYWLVASDGGVFAFNAPFFGSTGAITLNKPIVGIGTDINSLGYYLVASDGGVFAYNEPFKGSTGSFKLNKPVVGMAVDRAPGLDGSIGYWLVASDGGVFAFNAPFYGSTGSLALNKPMVAIAPLSDGSGYREVAADGGVFSYNAPFLGSAGSLTLNQPVVAGGNDNSTDGYWSFAADGGVFSYGTSFYGSAA